MNAKTIATYMGHSSIQITFDRYGHLMPGNEQEAASRIDSYLADALPAAATGGHAGGQTVYAAWLLYPWYREMTPDSPRSRLLADPSTEQWHSFGMEWKEHVAWISPMLATAAAFLVLYYGAGLVRNRTLRTLTIVLFIGGFVTAAIAGLLGALITKAAAVT